MYKASQEQLANPFSSATVVVADNFVDLFPHPQGLLAYLHRLCLQLDVDIVSLDRPVTVKGSWKTIIKIDAFLKTLISSLQNAISEGTVSEEDFNAVFSQFEGDGNYGHESMEDKQAVQDVLLSNELSELKTDDYFDIIKNDEARCDASLLDKWYFNSNPRGKTVDKSKRYSNSTKQPPEPYIIVEAESTSKTNQANLVEIEHVLSQVYRKETIEKYQKRSSDCDKNMHPPVLSEDFKSTKEEIIHNDGNQLKFPDTIGVERKLHLLMENTSSNSQPYVENSTSDIELKPLEMNLNCVGKDKVGDANEVPNTADQNSYHRPVRLRLTVRQNRSKTMKASETIDKDVKILKKRQKKHRKGGRTNKKYKGDHDDVKQVTKRKVSRLDKRDKETLTVVNQRVTRYSRRMNLENMSLEGCEKNSTNPECDLHKINKTTGDDILCKSTIFGNNKTENGDINNSRVETENKMSVECSEEENLIDDKKNNLAKKSSGFQYNCGQCSYKAIKHGQLLEHERRVHLTRKFRCEECRKEFGFLKDLRRHMKCHTKAENCCDICGKMYKEVRKLLEHKRTHADGYVKPEFPCKFCMKIFSTKYVLAYHIKADHLGMKRSYMCPTCGKSFSQKNSYLQHANVHLGIRPFTCEICGKRFSYDKSLREHKFMHNEKKVFSCSFCSKTFRQASGLAIHLKVHKTTKDYVCSMCGKGFSQKQALVRHERIHAGDKPYECALCKRTFADSSVLRRHMILIHKKDPKLWREDTKCYVPKRTDFFISVIDGDKPSAGDSHLKDLDAVGHSEFQEHHSHQQNQQEIQNKQMLFEQGEHVEAPTDTLKSLTIISGPLNSTVKMMLSNTDQRQAVGYRDGSCAGMKPYVGYGSEKAVVPEEVIGSRGAAERSVVEPVMFSTPVVQILTPTPMHSNMPGPAHLMTEMHQSHSPYSVHNIQPQADTLSSSSSSSFVASTYQQRHAVSYNTGPADVQPAQYSSMISQPYTQAIVFLQDSLEAMTCHQRGVNVAFSGDPMPHDARLHDTSPSVSTSPRLPHNPGLSQAISSVSSGQMYDQVLSTHQLPH